MMNEQLNMTDNGSCCDLSSLFIVMTDFPTISNCWFSISMSVCAYKPLYFEVISCSRH